MRCERCLRACKANAIYFEHGIRKVDYAKCKACLSCVTVCPRNAVEVSSITRAEQIVSIKIDHEKCSMCEICLDKEGKFCPQNLFYKDDVTGVRGKKLGIRYKYNEISKCQGCLKCELSCPDGAIEPIKFET